VGREQKEEGKRKRKGKGKAGSTDEVCIHHPDVKMMG
jgi:hypothetical protein